MPLALRPSLVLALTTLAGAASAEPRGFTVRDMVMLDRAIAPKASPDGRSAIYAMRSTDLAANRGVLSLWKLDLTGKAPPRRLAISDGGLSGARWSADGRFLYVLSGRSGSSQIWRADAEGEGAVQVTDLPVDVGAFRVSADGRRLVVALAVFPDCPTLACSVARRKATAESKATGQVFDRLFVRHWDEWADGSRNHLFALALDPATGKASGEAVDLTAGFDGDIPTKPFGDEADFALSPDGAGVVFSAKVAGKTEAWTTNFDLWRVRFDQAGKVENLTAGNPAWDAQPVFSPDGSKLAWRAMKRPGFEADRFGIMVRDLRTGATRELAPAWDRSSDDLAWSPDGRAVYVAAADLGQTRLFRIGLDGKVQPVTGDGTAGGMDVSRAGVLYTHDTLERPADVFRTGLSGGAARPLTRLNRERLEGVGLGRAEQFSFPGWNGETVRGYVVKPANWVEGRKYPVAFLIHGGPQGSFGNLWHYRWNAQTYAGAGYAVVMIDFHGSTGYGQAFTDSISQHWGDRPLEDLQKGWAYALSMYPFLDDDRACALGGSYGGYMVDWMAGNWSQPWRCLVSHDGVFDTRAMGFATEELWFSEWENGGTPWGNPQGYARFNPADHVGKWDKPMLIVQGGRDYRIPVEQALGPFNALQRRGIDSRLLYFPDENHWVLRPQNSIQWHDEVTAWLDRHTAP